MRSRIRERSGVGPGSSPEPFRLVVSMAGPEGDGLVAEYPFPADGDSCSTVFDASWARRGSLLTLRFRRRDGGAFDIGRLTARVSLPLLNYAHVVVPDCGRHYVNGAKALDIRAPLYRVTASNAGHPFFAVADEAGAMLRAFGIVTFTGETEIRRVLPRISSRKAMVGGDELLSLDFVWTPSESKASEVSVVFFDDTASTTWVHALRSYTGFIRRTEGIRYASHPAAWEPTWCTWTAFCSSDMTAERVLENARVARELGMGTVILDDGWFGVGLDDDHGTVNLGDYEPAPWKFPDLPAHVRELHALGLKTLLWHAPLCVASTSRTYGVWRRFLIRQNGREFVSVNGLAMLCPACPDVRAYVARETIRLMSAYGVDGLKVDLYNCLPTGSCDSTEHRHDIADGVAAVDRTMEEQWKAALAVRPDAFFELKQDYGNVRLARHGTMVRAGDTAYDVDTTIRRCFYVQAYAPCVHNDYFVTSVHASPAAVAMAMIRMLAAGVPTFGNNLAAAPRGHLDVIRAWLGFYNGHRSMFRARREPQANDLSSWQGGTRSRAWVAALWSCREVSLTDASVVFLMNGTGRDSLWIRVEASFMADLVARDHELRIVDRRAKRIGDGTRLDIPPAGMLEIRRR